MLKTRMFFRTTGVVMMLLNRAGTTGIGALTEPFMQQFRVSAEKNVAWQYGHSLAMQPSECTGMAGQQ
jgi:hypothetical protein